MHHIISEAVTADFSRRGHNGVCITFSDLEYLRAEAIIFNRRDRSLHAVLHESEHYIGQVKPDMVALFVENKEVILAAPHYEGGMIDLKTPLVVSD